MNIKKSLEKYFEKFKGKIKTDELIKILKIDIKYIDLVLNAIYELELEGKIYKDSDNYFARVPSLFYLKHGIVKVSNKGNYYIDYKKGKIFIKKSKLNNAKEGDTVYVKLDDDFDEHQNCHGSVFNVVKKYNNVNSNYICKAELKKDHKNSIYYVLVDNERIIIPFNKLNSAYPGDLVSVQINNNNGLISGNIVNVIKRLQTNHVFEYKSINGILNWIPIGTYPFKVTFNGDNKFKNGDRILAALNDNYEIKFIKKINHESAIVNDIISLIHDYGIDMDFSKDTIKEANAFSEINAKDLENRVDLRSLLTVTIDPETAKDLDDAISLERTEYGYRVYVHIADVSHYVKPNTHIYNEAMQKAASGYFANCVAAMLPPRLSCELCSLNPNEEKLAKTSIIDVDFDGNVLNFEIVKSVIKSDCKMNYDKVNEFLNGNENEYSQYRQLLISANELSKKLNKKRDERGCISFKVISYDFSLEENKVKMSEHVTDQAQLMIENIMLLNNSCCTSYMYWLNVPIIYRNHEVPDCRKISNLKDELNNYNYHIRTLNNANNPKILQRILTTLSSDKNKNKEEIKFLSKIFLKYMQRASYGSKNIGHYGLALEYYATFTSPIRKFSDLVNTIILDSIIEYRNLDFDDIEKQLPSICEHLNQQCYKIEQLEQAVNNNLFKLFIDKYKNTSLKATITHINPTGIYIKTENDFTGLIPLTKNMIFDYKKNTVINYEKEYYVGDEIYVDIVTVTGADFEILFDISKVKEKQLIRKKVKYEY